MPDIPKTVHHCRPEDNAPTEMRVEAAAHDQKHLFVSYLYHLKRHYTIIPWNSDAQAAQAD